VKTRFDRDIVEAAGIDASAYTDEQLASFADDLAGHGPVHAAAVKLAVRSFAAEVIAELSGEAQRKALHNTILRRCGQAPLVLKRY
jgi:hypothetical protein